MNNDAMLGQRTNPRTHPFAHPAFYQYNPACMNDLSGIMVAFSKGTNGDRHRKLFLHPGWELYIISWNI
jgi:hypothetical protein